MSTAQVVAAFDLDRTVTVRDCVVPFLRRCRPLPALVSRGLLEMSSVVRAAARRDRDLMKQAATRAALAGRRVGEVERIAEEFAATVAAAWLRADTLARLRWHQDQDHRVLFVSASYELYVRHLAAHLGVDAVLATRLERSEDRFSGNLVGPNCRGEEKSRRLLAWIEDRIGPRSTVELWAYGDSAGDRSMLAAADRPIWVGRDPLDPVPV